MFCKNGVYKNLANFTGKYLRHQVEPVTFEILKLGKFLRKLFYRTTPVAACNRRITKNFKQEVLKEGVWKFVNNREIIYTDRKTMRNQTKWRNLPVDSEKWQSCLHWHQMNEPKNVESAPAQLYYLFKMEASSATTRLVVPPVHLDLVYNDKNSFNWSYKARCLFVCVFPDI